MNKRTLGIIAVVVGVAVLVVSAGAGPLGLGGACFGPRHIAGTVLGGVVAMAGVALAMRRAAGGAAS